MAGVLGTIGEVEAAAKAALGKMNHGSVGPGSTFHMSAELFKAVADVNILHIAYRGGGPDWVETTSGQVNRSFSVLAAAVPHVQAASHEIVGMGLRHQLLEKSLKSVTFCFQEGNGEIFFVIELLYSTHAVRPRRNTLGFL